MRTGSSFEGKIENTSEGDKEAVPRRKFFMRASVLLATTARS